MTANAGISMSRARRPRWIWMSPAAG